MFCACSIFRNNFGTFVGEFFFLNVENTNMMTGSSRKLEVLIQKKHPKYTVERIKLVQTLNLIFRTNLECEINLINAIGNKFPNKKWNKLALRNKQNKQGCYFNFGELFSMEIVSWILACCASFTLAWRNEDSSKPVLPRLFVFVSIFEQRSTGTCCSPAHLNGKCPFKKAAATCCARCSNSFVSKKNIRVALHY